MDINLLVLLVIGGITLIILLLLIYISIMKFLMNYKF